jgi:hypothetical protein
LEGFWMETVDILSPFGVLGPLGWF